MRKIENIETGANNRPTKNVVISDCGEITVKEPFPLDK